MKDAIRTCFLATCAAVAAFSQPIEPEAGSWKTFVISSGKDFRVPPPPGEAETRAELGDGMGRKSHCGPKCGFTAPGQTGNSDQR